MLSSLFFDLITVDKAGQRVQTFYGRGVITDVKFHMPGSIRDPYFCTVRFPYGVAHLRSSFILHTIPTAVSSCSEEKNFARSLKGNYEVIEEKLDAQESPLSSCFTLFGTEKVYLFLRLYAALVSILAEARAYFASVDIYSPSISPDAGVYGDAKEDDTGRVKGRGIGDIERPGNQYNRGYAGLLCAVNDFMCGRLTYKAFESACRTLSLKLTFKFASLPKIIKKCAKELLKVVEEDAYLSLLDYARIPRLHMASLRDLSLRSTNGSAAYRIQYDPAAQLLMCCYLPKDVTMIVASPCSGAAASADSVGDYVDEADGEHEEVAEDDMSVDERDGFSGEESEAQRKVEQDEDTHNVLDHAPLLKRARTK